MSRTLTIVTSGAGVERVVENGVELPLFAAQPQPDLAKLDRDVLDAADMWGSQFAPQKNLLNKTASNLLDAVRARREAMKPRARYTVFYAPFTKDGQYGYPWAVLDSAKGDKAYCYSGREPEAHHIADLLNAAEESKK